MIKITVSGVAGSGKSTAAAIIAKKLKNSGMEVVIYDVDVYSSMYNELKNPRSSKKKLKKKKAVIEVRNTRRTGIGL